VQSAQAESARKQSTRLVELSAIRKQSRKLYGKAKREGALLTATHVHARGSDMARVGRKRKPELEREPNGRADRKKQEPRFAPAAIKRLSESAIAAASDPRLGTELGRLLLAGDITSRQAGAGWAWAEIAFEYYQAIGATPLQVKPISLERGAKTQAPDIESELGQELSEKDKRAVKRFERAHTVLLSQGLLGESAARRLCEGRGQAAFNYEDKLRAIKSLEALALYFAAC